jgi:hypothetical protein
VSFDGRRGQQGEEDNGAGDGCSGLGLWTPGRPVRENSATIARRLTNYSYYYRAVATWDAVTKTIKG